MARSSQDIETFIFSDTLVTAMCQLYIWKTLRDPGSGLDQFTTCVKGGCGITTEIGNMGKDEVDRM